MNRRSFLKKAATLPFVFKLFYCGSLKKPKRKSNIILISLDTLRSDGVGLYNKTKATPTPFIDKLGSDSIIYTNVYAPIPFTPPSHMSMLTGFYPDVHSVNGDNLEPGQLKNKILPSLISTLPEILKTFNYKTLGIYSSDWLDAGFGFGRGFDYYQTIKKKLNRGTLVTNQAIDLLDSFGGNDDAPPFFLFLHYYDIHSDFFKHHPPYAVPEKFQIEEYKMAAERFCNEKNEYATKYLLSAIKNKKMLPKKDIALLKELYLGGIRFTDSEVERLFEELKKRNLYNNTLIILTSDHGEEFQEHGKLLHEQVYEENVRVPLLIKLPESEKAGLTVEIPVELIDIMPTVLRYLNIEEPKDVQGTSILPADMDNKRREKSFILTQHKRYRSIYGVREDRFKLIYDIKTDYAELYDLLEDPNERNDISDDSSEIVRRLSDKLQARLKNCQDLYSGLSKEDKTKKTDAILSEKQKEKLKTLGYVK